jgi:hypothetical protein
MITQWFTVIAETLNARFVGKVSKEKQIWMVIYEHIRIREILSAKFVKRL